MSERRIVPESAQLALWYVSWGFVSLVGAGSSFIFLIPGDTVGSWVFIATLCAVGTISLLVAAWLPAYFRSLECVLGDDGINARRGVFWQRMVAIPYGKVTNVDILQGPLERLFGIGRVSVQTAGAGGAPGAIPELRLVGVRDVEGIREDVMARVKTLGARPIAVAKDLPPQPGVLPEVLQELREIRRLLEERRVRL